VAHGYDDVEGDIIERVRAIVGPDCVIGVELDPHCHLTRKRVAAADIIILYKEFPHTDVVERAEEVLTLVLRTIRKEIRPVMSLYDCRQIGSYPTTEPLMRAFVDKVSALEGTDGILSISIGHCFPYADVPELTGRVLVIADGDKAKSDRVATAIGEEFVSMRGRTAPPYLSVEEGITFAVEFNGAPVVMADPADNAGGGAPSDNTTILRAMIARGVKDAALGPIWMIGDRADTDLAMAVPPRWRGILVLSGATSDAEGIVPRPAAVVAALPGAIELILETGRRGDGDGG
jgi:microcystin degradation protein MlrC